uniref:WD_REPEATS_REGION domain-containing protein n=2 Tax=Macrostomum lignano TaxID=282301 RepID=A0A1I8IEP0_9PLAT
FQTTMDVAAEDSDQMPSGFHAKAAAKAARLRREAAKLASASALESPGGIESRPGEWAPTQSKLLRRVAVAARPGHFELSLQYGPYSVAYDTTGRLLALCGRGGHVAAFEWRQKRLMFESQVNEPCHALTWVGAGSTPQLAVAHSNWTYIYDAQGLELHCLKRLHKANKLFWLPRHWLLAACTDTGHLHWQDVSTGQTVASYCGHHGPLRVSALHPDSGCVLTGQPNGQLCIWTPLEKRPVVKMLCCPAGVRAVATAPAGHAVYTLGGDSRLRVWDIRCLRPLSVSDSGADAASIRLFDAAPQLAVSQRGLLACPVRQGAALMVLPAGGAKPLLSHPSPGRLSDLAFCPWEDVLAFGHARGLGSVLVPGSGEPNPDGAVHPLSGKRQRREAEVRGLLDKLPPETIAPPAVGGGVNAVDAEGIEEALARKRAAVMALPSDEVRQFQPRRRSGKASGELNRKVGERWQRRRMELRQLLKSKKRVLAEMGDEGADAAGGRKTKKAKKVSQSGELTKPATGTFLDRLIPKAD